MVLPPSTVTLWTNDHRYIKMEYGNMTFLQTTAQDSGTVKEHTLKYCIVQ